MPIASQPAVELEPVTDRKLTVPNIVSVTRIALVPVFAWLTVATPLRGQAVLLLAVLGATDFVDGWYARRFGQVSRLGKVLDPVADRLLLATAVCCTLWIGAAPWWVGLAVLAREALVASGAGLVAALGGRRIDVRQAGKTAAFAHMVALPAFLASTTSAFGDPVMWRFVAWTATAIGLGFGYWSLIGYATVGLAAVRTAQLEGDGPAERG